MDERLLKKYDYIVKEANEGDGRIYPCSIGAIRAIIDEGAYTPSDKVKRIKEVLSVLDYCKSI